MWLFQPLIDRNVHSVASNDLHKLEIDSYRRAMEFPDPHGLAQLDPDMSLKGNESLIFLRNKPTSSSSSSVSTDITVQTSLRSVVRSSPSLIDRLQYHAVSIGRFSVHLFSPPAVISPPSPSDALSCQYTSATMNLNHTVQSPNVADLLSNLSSNEDATRKMAAFKLQTLTNDPAFAEHFVAQGGLPKLRDVILETSGNTLAYGLSSFARLLEVDHGWDGVDDAIVEKAVELVVCQPLVNILRGAMAVLVSIVSRPHQEDRSQGTEHIGGFKALKPAINQYPQFLEMLVSRLSSADHALCANALQLINALMRDAITVDDETEWPKFIKRIQDLGVIKAVYVLMQSSALQDLAHPLLEFQQLTKVLLGRWRDVPVDIMKPEHRRTIKAIHLSSNPPDKEQLRDAENGHKPKHDPYKWRRLGFTSENPEPDFEDLGFLGMMDLSDYVRKHQEEFQNILTEQAMQPPTKQCPLARASLTVTAILFEHFEVDKMEDQESKAYLILDSRTNYEKVFRPLLLHWSRLHVAGLHAFFRLWKDTGAELHDFHKIMELVRILIESVVGGAERTQGIEEIEQELASFECKKLRELQMELLDLTYEDIWGPHLRGAKDELQSEALQFVKEQRIKCLLDGDWFHNNTANGESDFGGPVQENGPEQDAQGYRYIKLSPDRKYLHWGNFDMREGDIPSMSALPHKIDLSTVSSVVSNITANEEQFDDIDHDSSQRDSQKPEQFTTTKITIHGYESKLKGIPPKTKNQALGTNPRSSSRQSYPNTKQQQQQDREIVLLTFQPPNHVIASEWLDGLLMLLDQQPITAESNKLVNMIAEMGLKVRLLNVRGNDEEGIIGGLDGIEMPEIPSREGLDEDYYYEI